MNFRPELAELVMRGEKTVTRRLMSDNPRSPWWRGGCSLVKGRSYAVCPGRGRDAIGRVIVVDVYASRFGAVDDREARREGVADAAAFRALIETIQGSYDPNAAVWRIEMAPDTPAERARAARRGELVDVAGRFLYHGKGDEIEYIHECAHGHSWRQRPNGGVSPDYAGAGFSVRWPGWDPRHCPEPERFDADGDPVGLLRGLRCPGCGEIRVIGDMISCCSTMPSVPLDRYVETGHACSPPPPACGMPAVSSRAFIDGRWTPIDPGETFAAGEQLTLAHPRAPIPTCR